MAGLEHAAVDNAMLVHGTVQLGHGALLLLLPLFCGLISVFWCLFVQNFIWECYALSLRRKALLLHHLKLKSSWCTERGEDVNNVEQLSPKQRGLINGADRISRKLSRRASGLEHDLDACQLKLSSCQKENTKLQQELSEVYAIKSKFAELLKSESEKNSYLEKELKACQVRAAAALSDKDRLTLEVEAYQRREDDMLEKMSDLRDRLGRITAEFTEEKILCSDFQKELEKSKEQLNLFSQVVERFWREREQAYGPCGEYEDVQERAAILLQDPEGIWSYGESNKIFYDEAKQARENLATVQEELLLCRGALEGCKTEVEKESSARWKAEHQLSCLTQLVDAELQQLRLNQASLKEDVTALVLEEEKVIFALLEELLSMTKEEARLSRIQKSEDQVDLQNQSVEEVMERVIQVHCSSTGGPEENASCKEDLIIDESVQLCQSNGEALHGDHVSGNGHIGQSSESDKGEEAPVLLDSKLDPVENGEDKEHTKGSLNLGDEINGRDAAVDTRKLLVDDSREALVQALQEKVSALLLLSQQEERHILESNAAVVLESEITFLKQQLLQVTSEKVNALVELARAHEELLKLHEQEKASKQAYQHIRTFSSGDLSPVSDHAMFFDDTSPNGAKKASVQGYLKNLWLKGPDLGARTKSLSHMLTLRVSKENDAAGIARLRIENATMKESLRSIRHLCKSANRLRLTIAKVAAESGVETESSIQAAVDAVDGVISEALHLKVALHSTLPVDDLGWNSIGSPLARAGEVLHESSDYDVNDDLDIVSFLGLEIVRLVLLAAQLQKRFLGQNV